MALVVDPWHWLTPDGDIPSDQPRLRRNVLQVARVIEYGATLPPGQSRQTLLECTKRPAGIRCQGLLWVEKKADASLLAFCPACQIDHLLVYNWQGTRWAQGQLRPVFGSPTGEEE